MREPEREREREGGRKRDERERERESTSSISLSFPCNIQTNKQIPSDSDRGKRKWLPPQITSVHSIVCPKFNKIWASHIGL